MEGTQRKRPTEFLNSIKGKPVIVRLNSGVIYRGTLACLDGFMNIALEDTEEEVDGITRQRFGDSFIRGNNVCYISAA